jgi:hypothetical protein
MSHDRSACARAREQLSARLDGAEDGDRPSLSAHLEHCAGCRAHERDLELLAAAFAALREPTSQADLWPAIERRARRRRAALPAERLAAALVGFAGLISAQELFERSTGAPAPRHLLGRLTASDPGPERVFGALPEYRLLRAFLASEESR